MCRHNTKTELKNFMFSWSSSIHSGSSEKMQSACLVNSIIQVEQCDWSVEWLQFSFLMMWWHHQYFCNLSIYLLIPARMPLIAGLQYFLEYYILVLFLKTQFWIGIRDSKPAQIWTQISATKSGYANHWAILHWLYLQKYIL